MRRGERAPSKVPLEGVCPTGSRGKSKRVPVPTYARRPSVPDRHDPVTHVHRHPPASPHPRPECRHDPSLSRAPPRVLTSPQPRPDPSVDTTPGAHVPHSTSHSPDRSVDTTPTLHVPPPTTRVPTVPTRVSTRPQSFTYPPRPPTCHPPRPHVLTAPTRVTLCALRTTTCFRRLSVGVSSEVGD